MTNTDFAPILEQIQALPDDWHNEGSLAPGVLDAFIRNAKVLPLKRSMETGTGKSTLLLSHISNNHTVFTLEHDSSFLAASSCDILNKPNVEFVLGPSQQTLKSYPFTESLDLAFIDGPHGYPFPELEYYLIYPYLAEGALLIVDDIQIPTIFNLFSFLCEDEMFELLEVVNSNTAFFRRTGSEVFSPVGDKWGMQRYNANRYPISNLDIENVSVSAKNRAYGSERFIPAWDKITAEKHLASIVNSLPYRMWMKIRKFLPKPIRQLLGGRN